MQDKFEEQTLVSGNHHILYDPQLVTAPLADLFNPAALTAEGSLTGHAAGRGEAYFLRRGNAQWVLRHYRRGGLVGRFCRDTFLGWRVSASRSWREWRLLARLTQLGLPVPRPVAACATMGFGHYRADLITERIVNATTLADQLVEKDLPAEQWAAIGRCLKRFHACGVFHADLNARNILLDDQNRTFLIDFDRCEIRATGPWQLRNLQRLRRSLIKIGHGTTPWHFHDGNWDALLSGYRSA
ncbi:MAG: 3-deoxy-D-manno-octulosonic acid kinase [Pelovirga sp.]